MPRSYSRFFSFLIVVAILIASSPNAPAASGASGIDRMVRQIEGMFPVLEGYVLSVEGDRVTVDLKRGQSVKAGQTLKLIRFGKTLTHPVSQIVVGREETDLGQVKVLEVRKDYSIARVITPGVQASKGDGVRSVFNKINILVAPVQKDTGVPGDPQALALEIETQLNRRIRFNVPSFDLGVWLLENEISLATLSETKHLARLRQTVAADTILFTRIRNLKDQTVMMYRLVSASDGKVLKQAQVLVQALPVAQAPVHEQSLQTDLRRDKKLVNFSGKQDFDFEIVDFAVGDLTGNGAQEFVIIDRHRVLVYKYENKIFHKIGQVTTSENVNRFLSVDVADINGNGRDEIFVTNSLGSKLSSFVLEAVPGKKGLKRISEDLNQYFRVIRDFNEPPLLISQSPAFEKPFNPGINKMGYKNGAYTVDSALPLQSGNVRDLILYGVAFGQITPGKGKETLFLDNNYHLRVYSSRGRLLVSSDEYFGHDPRMIAVGVQDVVTGLANRPEEPHPVRFKGRLQLVQHNARKFLLLPKNHRKGGAMLGDLVIINESSLVFFAVSGEGLEKIYETKKQRGHLAAFKAVDTGQGHKQVHVASVADHGGFFVDKKISTIYTYTWKK